MNTENWRIRECEDMFFIEADLPKPYSNDNYPRVELMQEDYGDHNGYTEEMRRNDAELIVLAPKMKEAIKKVLDMYKNNIIPNIDIIENILSESIK